VGASKSPFAINVNTSAQRQSCVTVFVVREAFASNHEGGPVRAIFNVTVVNRETGAERVVRVEAPNVGEARKRVLMMGEMIGSAELAEVLEASPTTPQPTSPPGSVANACPDCQNTNWSGGRGVVAWLIVILLFPLGLLALLIRPTWKCTKCGFSYQSYSLPAGLPPQKSAGVQVLRGIGIALLLLFIVLVIGGAVAAAIGY